MKRFVIQAAKCLKSYSATHSILGDSRAKNRSQKKCWMGSLSHLLFFMVDGRLDAERGLTRAQLSLSLIRKKQDGSQKQGKDITTSPMSHALGPCSLLHTHSHTNTHSHTCINNIYAEIELLSLHIDDCLLVWRRWTEAVRLSNVRHNFIHVVSSQQQILF